MDTITKQVKPFGAGSAHVVVPKEWIGREVTVYPAGTKPITWENIEALIQEKLKGTDLKSIKKLIEDKIEEAKRGY